MSGASNRDGDAVDLEAHAIQCLILDSDPSSRVKKRGRESPMQKAVLVPGSTHRRCYGAAVEAALADVLKDPGERRSAPRLRELMSQLDADGHNTTALRRELAQLLAWG